MLIGCVVLVVAFAFLFTKLPEIREHSDEDTEENPSMKLLLKLPFFILAVVAQFFYVAGQTGVNSFFINYVTEEVTNVQVAIEHVTNNLGYLAKFSNQIIQNTQHH